MATASDVRNQELDPLKEREQNLTDSEMLRWRQNFEAHVAETILAERAFLIEVVGQALGERELQLREQIEQTIETKLSRGSARAARLPWRDWPDRATGRAWDSWRPRGQRRSRRARPAWSGRLPWRGRTDRAAGRARYRRRSGRERCQIASNYDPPFACKDDPALVRECFASDGAKTGAAEPHIAEQSRSWRAASGGREVMRGS